MRVRLPQRGLRLALPWPELPLRPLVLLQCLPRYRVEGGLCWRRLLPPNLPWLKRGVLLLGQRCGIRHLKAVQPLHKGVPLRLAADPQLLEHLRGGHKITGR